MEKRKFITTKDAVIVVVLLILSLLLFAVFQYNSRKKHGQGPLYVTITSGGDVLYSGSLSEDYLFTFPANENVVIKIKDSQAWFFQSDCPDQLCVKQGHLTAGGEMAACLPNRIILRITGDSNDTLDAVT